MIRACVLSSAVAATLGACATTLESEPGDKTTEDTKSDNPLPNQNELIRLSDEEHDALRVGDVDCLYTGTIGGQPAPGGGPGYNQRVKLACLPIGNPFLPTQLYISITDFGHITAGGITGAYQVYRVPNMFQASPSEASVTTDAGGATVKFTAVSQTLEYKLVPFHYEVRIDLSGTHVEPTVKTSIKFTHD